MKRDQGFSLLGRFVRGKASASGGNAAGMAGLAQQVPVESPPTTLSGSALEQAYRDLLLENQVLAETNQRLHERLLRRQSGAEESPAARELIQAQRHALAERSRRMRELEYENKQLKREQKNLIDENRQLSASLARQIQDRQPLLRNDEASRRELEETKAALREKTNQLLRLTDKYYQLKARNGPQAPPNSAANSDL
jgi:predicted RNase H-like nuclease (RuvC/YqgF family)